MILVRIKREDFTWQQTVCLVLPVQYRDMRDDAALRKPAQEGAGAIGFIRCQLLGLESLFLVYSLQPGFRGDDLLRQSCRSGFDVNDDGMFGVDKIAVEVAEFASPFLHVPCSSWSCRREIPGFARMNRVPCTQCFQVSEAPPQPLRPPITSKNQPPHDVPFFASDVELRT